jgi:tol-pal system protein YbgF
MPFFLLASRVLLAVALALPGLACAADAGEAQPPGPVRFAQGYGRPPAPVGDGEDQDAAGLVLRIDRLENQMRQLTGQIEQMQFETKKLEDQLRKFQGDVEYRFQESPRGATPAATPTRQKRSDAFDPASDPAAPGAPRPIGAASPSAPLSAPLVNNPGGPIALDDADAPLDLSGSNFRRDTPAASPRAAASGTPTAALTTSSGTQIAAPPTAVNSAKEEFDLALGYYKQKEYENAELGFAGFLQKNPKNRLASEAIYYLGETYYQRGRQREAAEQYLKISREYPNTSHAPEAMLRLGQSLRALGAKEQACATFSEVPRKYPNASAAIKAGAEREAKRAQC